VSRWFRFYDDVINDPKVLSLSDACFRGWVGLLCVASKNGGTLPSTADLAFHLRMKPQRVAALIAELTAAGLIDKTEGGFAPHNWGGRQYISDSTERVKRHREKREAAGLVAQWSAPKALRKEVYARDNHECVYCGSADDLTLDHKTPEIRGGSHDISNLQTACRKCNASKRDLTHEEFVTRGVTNGVTKPFQERPQSTENRIQSRTETLPSVAERADESGARTKSKKRAVPLPADWLPSEKSYAIAEQFGQNVQIVEGIFRDYVASSGKLYADHDAARGTTWRDHDVRANPTTRRLRSMTGSHTTC
jgi:hypothetical protein